MEPASFDWIAKDFRSLVPADAQSARPEPGRWQDELLTNWYRGKMLGRVGGRNFVERDPEVFSREPVKVITGTSGWRTSRSPASSP